MTTLLNDPNEPQSWFAGNELDGCSQADFLNNITTPPFQAVRQLMEVTLPGRYYFDDRAPKNLGLKLANDPKSGTPTPTGNFAQFRNPGNNVSGQITIFPHSHWDTGINFGNISPSEGGFGYPIVPTTNTTRLGISPQFRWYAASNGKSFCIFGYSLNGDYIFRFLGELNTQLDIPYVTKIAAIATGKAGSFSDEIAWRRSSPQGNNTFRFHTTGLGNYEIVCKNGANSSVCDVKVTELWLRQVDQEGGVDGIGIGYCDFLLLAKGQSWRIGEIIEVQPVGPACQSSNEPINGSTSKKYICCSRWGTDSLLMRVGDTNWPTYSYQIFSQSGEWDWVSSGQPTEVDVLIVGGGGAGAAGRAGTALAGGGGGAGGVRLLKNYQVNGNVTVTVGLGGAQTPVGQNGVADNGQSSSFGNEFVLGGGGGSNSLTPGGDGGSGGGNTFFGIFGSGVPGQGNSGSGNGGNGHSSSPTGGTNAVNGTGSGGGGGGTNWGSGGATVGGKGGDGIVIVRWRNS